MIMRVRDNNEGKLIGEDVDKVRRRGRGMTRCNNEGVGRRIIQNCRRKSVNDKINTKYFHKWEDAKSDETLLAATAAAVAAHA